MARLPSLLSWLALVCAGIACGYAFQRLSEPSATGPIASADRAPGQSTATPATFLSAMAEPVAYRRQLLAFSFLQQLDARELAEAVTLLRQETPVDQPLLTAFLQRLAQLDVQAALELARPESGQDWLAIFEAALPGLLEANPSAVRAWLDQLPRRARRQAENPWLKQAGERDPASAIRWALQASVYPGAVGELFRRLGARQPQEAIALASAWDQRRRVRFDVDVLAGWMTADRAAALAYLQSRASNPKEFEPLLWALDELEPAQALAFLDTLPPSKARQRRREKSLERLANRDLPAAIAWWQAHSEEFPLGALLPLMTRWAEVDPRAALQALLQVQDPDALATLVPRVLQPWLEKDWAAARAWIAGLPHGAIREAALHIYLDSASFGHPVRASEGEPGDPLSDLALIEDDLNPSSNKRRWIGNFLERLAQTNLPAVLAWIESRPGDPDWRSEWQHAVFASAARKSPGATAEAVLALVPPRTERELSQRRELLGMIARTLAERDPLAATRWTARITDQDQLASVQQAIASEWAGRDPAAAYRWALSLPGATAQEGPLLRIAERWLRTDAAATFAALDQLPASTRQLVLPGILSQYASEDPADAALRAARLPAGPERRRVFDEILRQWTQSAPEQARAWARRNQREFTPPDADR